MSIDTIIITDEYPMIELKSKIFRNSKLSPFEKGKVFYSNFIEIDKNMQTYKAHGQIHKFAFSLITLTNLSEEMKHVISLCVDENQKQELQGLFDEMTRTIEEYKNRISLI